VLAMNTRLNLAQSSKILKPIVRKGARNVASIDARVLEQLEAGHLETANLAEGLGINMSKLLASVAPNVPKNALNLELGVVQRMAQAGAILRQFNLSLDEHPSDTVRGWAAFAIGQDESIPPQKRLTAIKPFAADLHFGVREWAWMAVRAIIVSDPMMAIKMLEPWVSNKSANVRRFASEATRPRGVWAASIPLLRQEPQLALPILNSLKKDPERYVQDSVANWLNDAGKDRPDWVQTLLQQWQKENVSEYVISRAGRSLKKPKSN
jgi:3-methyladenine DNA glycosylase AlkC